MPFSLGFQVYPWVERVLQVRQYPLAAYGLALLMVALAVLGRGLVVQYIGEQVFASFYPAIIIAALVGGLWPGILATALSVLAAWYLVLPHFFVQPGEKQLLKVLLFVLFSGIDLAIAIVLSRLVERLIIQQRNIRLLLEAAPNGFVLVDQTGTIKLVNASAEKLFGYSRKELVGKNVEALVPERDVPAHRKARSLYQEKPEVRLMGLGRNLSGQRKDGNEFPVEIGLNPVGRDHPPAVLATVMDISARKQAEEQQRLVIGELKHRTRNLLAVVQAVVSNTVKDAKTVSEAAYVLTGRLKAISDAYMLLADAAWEGTSLAKILSAHPVLNNQRVTVEGCNVVLTPRAAQSFAMIVNELATNSLKYGALSSPDARMSITGKIDRYDGGGLFTFSWKESGVSPIAPPIRKGFGSVILLEAAHEFGKVTMDYLPEGLLYELKLDLNLIEAKKAPAPNDRTTLVADA